MAIKTVGGEALVPAIHEAVASHLRNHACRRDAEGQSIASNQCGLRVGKGTDKEPIHQDVFRMRRQRSKCALHGPVGGTKDVHVVDLRHGRKPHGMANIRVGGQAKKKFFTNGRAELLRIRKASHSKRGRQYHGGGDHGSGDRTPADFVDARDAAASRFTEPVFIPQAATSGSRHPATVPEAP